MYLKDQTLFTRIQYFNKHKKHSSNNVYISYISISIATHIFAV